MPVTTKSKRKQADTGKLVKNVATVVGVGAGAAFGTGAVVGGGYKVASGTAKLAAAGMGKAYEAGKTGFGLTKIPGMIEKRKKAKRVKKVKDYLAKRKLRTPKNTPKLLGMGKGKSGPKAMAKGIDLVDGKETERVRYRSVQSQEQKAKEKAFRKRKTPNKLNPTLKVTKKPISGTKPIPGKGGDKITRRSISTGRKLKSSDFSKSQQRKAKGMKRINTLKYPQPGAVSQAKNADLKKGVIKKRAQIDQFKGKSKMIAQSKGMKGRAAARALGKGAIKMAGKRAVAFIPGVGLPLAGAMTVYDIAKLANNKRKKR